MRARVIGLGFAHPLHTRPGLGFVRLSVAPASTRRHRRPRQAASPSAAAPSAPPLAPFQYAGPTGWIGCDPAAPVGGLAAPFEDEADSAQGDGFAFSAAAEDSLDSDPYKNCC
jgi:hypothetical protein